MKSLFYYKKGDVGEAQEADGDLGQGLQDVREGCSRSVRGGHQAMDSLPGQLLISEEFTRLVTEQLTVQPVSY